MVYIKNKNEIKNKYKIKKEKNIYLYENKIKEIKENLDKIFNSNNYDERNNKLCGFKKINEIIEQTYIIIIIIIIIVKI